MQNTFFDLKERYRIGLLEDVIPFWTKNSIDDEFGGYFTCLDRKGKVYDTDKFTWLQARQVWTYSMLYNRMDPRKEWLEIAGQGARFLKKKGKDSNGDFYFSMDRQGAPLIQPYNVFSDCFATLAFYEYGLASRNSGYKNLAHKTFQQIWARQSNPKGKYEKSTGNRPVKGFALPMILANMLLEIEGMLSESEVEEAINHCIHEVMEVFYHPETGLIHEYVSLDETFMDTFEGRLINPGHGIEAMWFIMDIAYKQEDPVLMNQAIHRTLALLDFGWDREYGGIFYFMDAKGAPPLQLEWDQKLWWVHLEALVALAKAYQYTGRADVWDWYQRVDEYTWSHFPDPEHGEWWGYLNRRGEVLIPQKGGKWKGCYHVPRAFYQCWRAFEEIYENNRASR